MDEALAPSVQVPTLSDIEEHVADGRALARSIIKEIQDGRQRLDPRTPNANLTSTDARSDSGTRRMDGGRIKAVARGLFFAPRKKGEVAEAASDAIKIWPRHPALVYSWIALLLGFTYTFAVHFIFSRKREWAIIFFTGTVCRFLHIIK